MSVGFSCTINPADREATAKMSERGVEICYMISDLIAKNHDTHAARGNWFVNLKTREPGTLVLICYFYKRKLEREIENDDETVAKTIAEWVHTINENPEKWESKWRG